MKRPLLLFFLTLISFFSHSQYKWAKNIAAVINDMTTDSIGNSYITGFFTGTVDFDPSASTANLSSNGGSTNDIFIAKYDSSGNYQWAKQIGGSDSFSYGEAKGISINKTNGNIYITGNYKGDVDFDPAAGTAILSYTNGGNSYFIASYGPSGNYFWATTVDKAGGIIGNSVSTDILGNAYVLGTFSGSIDFDPGSATFILNGATPSDIFIAKYTTAGVFVWAGKIGGQSTEEGTKIICDPAGNSYITGFFEDSVDFDPGSGSAKIKAGWRSVFFAKYNSAGNYQWAKAINSAGDWAEGYDMVLDQTGNIYLTGIYIGTFDFDGGNGVTTMTTSGVHDSYIAKYDNSGNYMWSKHLQPTFGNYVTAYALAVDKLNNIYITGLYSGTVDFDPGDDFAFGTSAGMTDIFMVKLNDIGEIIWAKGIGNIDYDSGRCIELDKYNNIYLGGFFISTVDFDPSPSVANLTSTGASNIFIAKYGLSTVGVEEFGFEKTMISLYPIPSSNEFFINSDKEFNATVYSSLGQIMEELDGKGIISFGKSYPAGIYFVRVNSGDESRTLKVVKY